MSRGANEEDTTDAEVGCEEEDQGDQTPEVDESEDEGERAQPKTKLEIIQTEPEEEINLAKIVNNPT